MERDGFDLVVQKKNFNEVKTTNRKVCTVLGIDLKKSRVQGRAGILMQLGSGGIRQGLRERSNGKE